MQWGNNLGVTSIPSTNYDRIYSLSIGCNFRNKVEILCHEASSREEKT